MSYEICFYLVFVTSTWITFKKDLLFLKKKKKEIYVQFLNCFLSS